MVSKRGQAVLISLQNVRSALLNGKTLQWRVLSGEGHGSGKNVWHRAEHEVLVLGALAQLGERLICIQEVNGSIPLGSTMTGIGSVAQVVRAHA